VLIGRAGIGAVAFLREVAHEERVHPLVLQALQELREPLQIDHARRLGQALDRRAFHGVEDALQVFHRLFEEIGQRPDPDIGAAAAVAQDLDELRLRPLQSRCLGPDVREIPVRREQAHGPGPGDDRDLRIVVIGHEGAGRWLSCGPNMKTCRSPRVFQIRFVRNASGL
jgi:hypothetical protein